jgi:5-oxoprolinase (ATP-hydrolysing)
MPGVRVLFMQSSGGLTDAGRFQGKDAILSGPAGGIVGMAQCAGAAGHTRLIGFDMGGTSTDVSHYAGEYERVFDTEVAGVRVRAPMMSIHTIAAGGGSIIRFDGSRLRVGPESAGADPGPACYRRGGPLTVTDANVLLGRIHAAHFPQAFGPDGRQPIDRALVQARFGELAQRMSTSAGYAIGPEEAAAGALRIAVGSMANAIKRISVARGYDVRRYTLQCFGGAGGQHACQVADALGIEHIFCHPLAGVLSALGMGLADQIVLREATLESVLDPAGVAEARRLALRLAEDAGAALAAQGVPAERVRRKARLMMRYRGTDTALACELPPADDAAAIRAEFETLYRHRFAFLMEKLDLVIESVTVECVGVAESVQANVAQRAGEWLGIGPVATRPAAAPPSAGRGAEAVATPPPDAGPPESATSRIDINGSRIDMYCAADDQPAGWRGGRLIDGEALAAGTSIEGPAIIAQKNATVVVEPGWRALVTALGNLELTRVRAPPAARALGTQADPVLLEVFNNLFMNVAEQMGLALQNTAHSVNIKERLDFSCAVFDASGNLIANAPHMPVHLGSMSESIRTIIEANSTLAPGEAYVLNDPYRGGTHLPDITVVTPVFLEGGPPAGAAAPADAASARASTAPSFFVASRGHHADVGGITPGSMPPFSTSIEEEGVLIDNFKLLEAGRLHEQALLELLTRGPYPARNPAQNVADLRAQIAANEKGARELGALVEQFGPDTVARYMRHVQDHAEECVRRVITALRDGEFVLTLDNGAQIRVAVRVDTERRSARIDFTGTSAQLPDNFNAPRAITVAAVLYVFRTLVDDDIPLNAGCLKPLEIIVPEGCMLNPRPPAAVVAGNVETSTCVTNALYGALGVMAASQCTMNNFTFGNDRYQYYETIAGGSGAGDGFDGTSVVQTHMTNSRLTDPEVLEFRFPVRLDSYEIRAGSGGAGRWRGGDGGVRRVRFLEPMTASILSNGRSRGAFGMAGGEPGAPGENRIERAQGGVEILGAIGQSEMGAGDVFVVATPGGGGYGPGSGGTAGGGIG